jgi:hypothetical protein
MQYTSQFDSQKELWHANIHTSQVAEKSIYDLIKIIFQLITYMKTYKC